MPTVGIKRLPSGEALSLPSYATPGSAGMDLRAAHAGTIRPRFRALIPCGISLAIPPGWEGQIRPRSGLALNHGITVLNAPGTIDSDFRGEIAVVLINLGNQDWEYAYGDRIAQLVLTPIARAELIECEELPRTLRGSGGMGSTGV